jgi:hypothetical protein
MSRTASLILGALLLGLLAGCIADTAEDTDLPWARNQGWEGMLPLPLNTGGGSQYD